MTDFFSRLAARSLGVARVVQPRIRSRYAASAPGDADTELVREAWLEQPGGLPVATQLQEDRGRGHSSPSLPRPQPAVPQTESRGASRVVPAGGVESGRAALQDGREPIPANAVPFSSRPEMNAIEARREVLGPGGARSGESSTGSPVPEVGPHQSEWSAETPAGPARQTNAAIAAPSPLSARGYDVQQPPLDMRSATGQRNQEDPPRVVSQPPPLNEAVRPRPAAADFEHALEADTPPEIHVSIGRIEVRAMMAPAVQPPRASRPANAPALSLEAYLQKRLEGSR
jgi:hypothetical protein